MGGGRLRPAAALSAMRNAVAGTLVLEIEFTTEPGVVRVVDCMAPGEDVPNVVRVVVDPEVLLMPGGFERHFEPLLAAPKVSPAKNLHR
jgi:hypothetical protein